MADQPFTPGFAFRETSLALVGAHVRGSAHLVGAFGDWFPLSVLLLGVTGATCDPLRLARPLAAPRARRRRGNASSPARSSGASGSDTLAPFVLRADKSYFFSPDERAFLAYRVVGGVAVVSGDPIGAREVFGDLVEAFIRHAHERDWRIAILGASERCLELYRRHGLHALYHGDEAVLHVDAFSLDGRAIRKVRQSVHRLGAAGYAGAGVAAGRDRAGAARGARGGGPRLARR